MKIISSDELHKTFPFASSSSSIVYYDINKFKMKMIPLFRCLEMKKALDFYTKVLDFTLADEKATHHDVVVLLSNAGASLMLTALEGDQKPGIATNVFVDDVDSLFIKYRSRGLKPKGKEDSPVHNAPVDQTWGTREFYVSDEDGNTLRFVQEKIA